MTGGKQRRDDLSELQTRGGTGKGFQLGLVYFLVHIWLYPRHVLCGLLLNQDGE